VVRFRGVLALLAFVAGAFACSSQSLKGGPGSSGDVPPDVDPGVAPDGGRDANPGGLPLPASRAVTIQVQPTDQGAALLQAIRGAQTSVHMTMYLLSDNAVIDALGDLKDAGKDVKVVLNRTFPANGGDNQPAFNTLQSRGVSVVWAPTAYSFTHAKMIVIDNTKLILMTMNLTYSSPRTNREYIATDTEPDDVKDAETLFQADFTNQNAFVKGKLVVSPRQSTPTEARARLKALIDSATTSLDVEAQSLSDDTIVDAIILAHQAKVATRVVINGDFGGTPAQADAVAKLKQNGVPLRALASPDVHAKAIVVDGTRAFVGSMNLTSTALTVNRELGLVTDAKGEAEKVRDVIAADFAKGSAP
jgi:phosphatidylserine/phosphatidylglycerophosphate/cardiolipin synthase-like enzyme